MEPPAAAIPAFVALARHIPIVVLTPPGVVLAATMAAERVLDCPLGSLIGRAWTDVCVDPPTQIGEYLDQCARTLAPIPGAFRRNVGSVAIRFRCEGYATALRGEPTRAIILQIRRQDKQDNFIMLGQKIEELNSEVLRRRQSEKRLSEAQARLNAILDQMPAAVIIAEAPSGQTAYANREAKEILGGERETNSIAWHADGRRCVADDLPMATALQGEIVVGKELELRRADGSASVVRANAAPIRDEVGEIVAAVTAYYDVTEQKRLERITHAARAEAETASRAKDEFLAMLGHELRNPLAPILTALHLMQLRGVGAEKERNIIERQVKHVVRLVDDLLDVSRFASGKIELRRERIELGGVVARAIEMASPLLEKREHNLCLDVPAHGLIVEADSARLAQVVSNLLTNAAKYSEHGAPIWLTATHDDDQVVLKIRDSGIGIAADMLPRIFDRFVQETQALDRAQGGLGLGLAIVRSLVELHGGTVAAHSEGSGRGSEFVVRLPADRASHLPAVNDLVIRQSRNVAAGATGFKLLVVDDNEDGAEMLSETLRAMGHTTRIAHDGPSALRLVEDFTPQLALLDIGLPVMDGYELAERLREEPSLRDIRLVAVTGYGQETDRNRSRAAGFDAHLVKPVHLDDLESIVRELLGRTAVVSSGK